MLLRRANRPPRKMVVDPSGPSRFSTPLTSAPWCICPRAVLPRKSIVSRAELHAGLQAHLAAVKAVDGAEFIPEVDPAAAEAGHAGRHLELLVGDDRVFKSQKAETAWGASRWGHGRATMSR